MTQTDRLSPLPASIRSAGSRRGGVTYVPAGGGAPEDGASEDGAAEDGAPEDDPSLVPPFGMATTGVSLLGLDFADMTLARAAAWVAARPADAPFG